MNLFELGVAKNKIGQFEKKGILDVESLLRFIPKKYYDFRQITPIAQTKQDQIVSIVGVVESIAESNQLVRAKVKDQSGKILHVIWFHGKHILFQLKIKQTYIFCGKIRIDETYHQTQMVQPILFSENIKEGQRIHPVYSKIPGMSEDYLKNTINAALEQYQIHDPLEPHLLKQFDLDNLGYSLREIHHPSSIESLRKARKRLVFDELFRFQMQLFQQHSMNLKKSPFSMPKIKTIEPFLKRLPFQLTEGQRETLRSIYLPMKNGERVNALIQGDVGSGKTIIAIIMMLIAAENGYQSALMAPTTVLAEQHYRDLVERTRGMGYQVALLTGETKGKEKKNILNGIQSGVIQLVVGTHAVIQPAVQFSRLALTIVDEEHRFGVEQRNELRNKESEGVHHITMSATPIPRSLAMTIYGDFVQVSTITTMPKGRKPIQTKHLTETTEMFQRMEEEIRLGHQAYVVCPLIEDSDNDAMAEVESAEMVYAEIVDYFSPSVNVGLITGKMKKTEIDEVLGAFTRNDIQVLVSTTIIEVGVNVPNATVIAIRNAERFGLAQLHQLRGRVGRGSDQAFCLLVSKDRKNPKLKAMVETNDGFKIAEMDLKLRGSGDFIGTKQSGENTSLMLTMAYPNLFRRIKEEVILIFQNTARIKKYEWMFRVIKPEKVAK